ncbi:MAG: LuxR C-terminal-related transcriptional regulator, partial [Chloroflexi bacterium]|nr:LuxR C-terminal-related transcriptional regulator [Chloroflexota bacterium]
MREWAPVCFGEGWFSKPVVEKMARMGSADAFAAKSMALTERETQVLQRMAVGKTDWRIGQELAISERTVRRHLQEIYCKLGVDNRAEAVARAATLGLVE